MALVGKGRTVIVGPVRYPELCPIGHRMLTEAGFTLVVNQDTTPWTRKDLTPLLPFADAAICGVEIYDATALAQAPRLRVISRLGVGLDNIDGVAARAQGTHVVNAPGGNAAAVGELALGLILAVLRRVPVMDRDLHAGRWDRYVGTELAGKAVGLVGFGATAQVLARRLAGFDVSVCAFDPAPDRSTAAELGVAMVALDDLLSRSDVLSLHAPHNAHTHHLIDADALSTMKSTAILINTSRGGLVDQPALVEALRSGRIAGAGLDVFAKEPLPSDDAVLELPNVVVSPHCAADTWEAYERIGVSSAQAIIDVFSGVTPRNLAN